MNSLLQTSLLKIILNWILANITYSVVRTTIIDFNIRVSSSTVRLIFFSFPYSWNMQWFKNQNCHSSESTRQFRFFRRKDYNFYNWYSNEHQGSPISDAKVIEAQIRYYVIYAYYVIAFNQQIAMTSILFWSEQKCHSGGMQIMQTCFFKLSKSNKNLIPTLGILFFVFFWQV